MILYIKKDFCDEYFVANSNNIPIMADLMIEQVKKVQPGSH